MLGALGDATAKLRGQLGESLASVQKFDAPLEEVKAYSLASTDLNQGGQALQPATWSEPFSWIQTSLAYRYLGGVYTNLYGPARGAMYFAKAYELRDQASERERLQITADYYATVLGDLSRAAEASEQIVANYPRIARERNSMAVIYGEQGQYERAVELIRPAIAMQPDDVRYPDNLANYLVALQWMDEARETSKPQDEIFQLARMGLGDPYIRGQVYLAAGQGTAAAAEFQKIQARAGGHNGGDLVSASISKSLADAGVS